MSAALWLAWGRHAVERLSWPGLIGLALVVGALAVQVGGTNQMVERNEELQQTIDRLLQRNSSETETLPAVEVHALAALPSGDELVPLVAAVHAGARRRQVALEQGEYLWQPEPGSGGRYRLSFPARGSYPQLRGWVADLLGLWPSLSLEEFDLRRDNVASETVEAQVRFTVRVGGAR